jgi:hypothetical protein
MAVSPRAQSNIEPADAPSVSAEMEAIFLDATGRPSTRRAQLAEAFEVSRIAPATPRRPMMSPGSLGAVAAVVLAGLSAGAVLMSQRSAPPVAQAAPPPITAPVSSASPPAIVAVTSQGPDQTAAPALRPLIKASAPPRRAVHAARTRPSHAELMVADRRLRRAYARAVNAGVPRPILADYRNRWDDLRHEASWRPERVRVGYDAMTRDLTRMSSPPLRHRSGRERRW